MKILVTGGAGFIGSHLVDKLVKDNHMVTIVDDLSTGLIENLNVVKSEIDLRVGSILNTEFVRSVLRKDFDIIFHTASVVGVHLCVKDPRDVFKVNTLGSEILYECIALHPKKPKVILFSTSEVAGKSKDIPLTEKSLREFGDTTVSRWVYGESKAMEEMLGFWYGNKFGFEVKAVRLFNVIGPRQRGEYGMVVPKFITQALTEKPITVYSDGKQIRSFTWVGDIVNGFINLFVEDRKYEDRVIESVINLGNPKPVSINELAVLIKKKTNSDSEIVHLPFDSVFKGDEFDEIQTRIPDITVAKKYGFEPKVDLEESLDYCIYYIKEKLKRR